MKNWIVLIGDRGNGGVGVLDLRVRLLDLINELLMFILMTSEKYNIDESHDISHSMDVIHFANDIYEKQVHLYPSLKHYKNVIQICALLRDMCYKKYMDEDLLRVEGDFKPHDDNRMI